MGKFLLTENQRAALLELHKRNQEHPARSYTCEDLGAHWSALAKLERRGFAEDMNPTRRPAKWRITHRGRARAERYRMEDK